MKLKTLVQIGLVLWAVDILAFFWWVFSGQIPPDGFFIGGMSWHIVYAIMHVDWVGAYPYALFVWIFLSPVLGAVLGYLAGKAYMYKELADVWEALSKQTRLFKMHSQIEDQLTTSLSRRIAVLEDARPKKVRKLRVKSKRA